MSSKVLFLSAVFAATVLAETPRTVVLDVVIDNLVNYRFDVADALKRGVVPTRVDPIPDRAFLEFYSIGDIIQVNGKPAKGMWTNWGVVTGFSLNPSPGNAVANIETGAPLFCNLTFYTDKGAFVGALFDGGGGAGTSATAHAITGGSGVFVGARGQKQGGTQPDPTRPVIRRASAAEDPAQRHTLGGGSHRFLVHLIPSIYPEIVSTPDGPGVFHAEDFSLVTQAKPAHSGETLIIRARNLGFTTPNVPLGQPFPAWPGNSSPEVNADVDVTFNGAPGEVYYKIGWPGEVGIYRVDLRVPSGVSPGMANVQLTAGWVPSEVVRIPVQ